ncbi:hypothetical protein PK35_08755 [Tamlana nanhaiensis]|uniref:DUF4179 domain-containing protein n=1 Tax=Neotamlana nanhaiensis TaxID=1382798 RepID=A0A0D7W1T1_9FLAO|nr:hypothetical protein [Tamlana nanhaiensis]KJD33046.1 hypothetical protein PK35_08755 [Tamlana nanhaiensis]
MSKNNIDNLFKNLENKFDVAQPNTGHENRFLEKLNNTPKAKTIAFKKSFWKPIMGIAASLVLIFTFVLNTNKPETALDLASVSPKMAQTQDFFTVTINEELNKLNNEKSPEVQGLIKDTMFQIKKLENDYSLLKEDLYESGDDNRVIYAMISNFQSRIEILQQTLQQIDNIKQMKADTTNQEPEII